MGLFSFGRSDSRTQRPAPRRASGRASSADALLDLRRKARRRLIGAVVLVIAAFIGLPMLLQSARRPVAPDLPIEIARDATAPALAQPAEAPNGLGSAAAPAPVPAEPPAAASPAPASAPVASAPVSREVAPVTPERAPAAIEPTRQPEPAHPSLRTEPATRPEPRTSEPLQRQAEPARPAEPSRPAEVARPAPRAEPAHAEPKPEPKPEPRVEPKPADGARALALLEGKPVPAPAPTAAHDTPSRFLVQMGAFATEAKVQELQARLRAAGVSTYTETISTGAGPRIRLRAGPFASRGDADSVRQKAAGAGIGDAAVLAQ
ncbi:SPOR domain-containing protein [Derxia lacustris]|uniref:SPOR domain-containing protein n=1 Tax=Derxia lacustris TaxID=764842 RepID=UPI000A178197|nr:SPOR domain-containing protein [Derxia lacustris]